MQELNDLSEGLNKDLLEAKSISDSLSASLGEINQKSGSVKDDIKVLLGDLAKLREKLIKCDDASGSDDQICQRLQQAKSIQSDILKCGDKIAPIKEKITDLKKHFGKSDGNNLDKELSNLEKKQDALAKATLAIYKPKQSCQDS